MPWECLNDGGLFIYSTCTFNTKENEENIRWILDNYEAEVLEIETRPEWNITGSLLEGFTEPVYRFIPGITRSEGLFICALRKGSSPIVPSEEAHHSHRGKTLSHRGSHRSHWGNYHGGGTCRTDSPILPSGNGISKA